MQYPMQYTRNLNPLIFVICNGQLRDNNCECNTLSRTKTKSVFLNWEIMTHQKKKIWEIMGDHLEHTKLGLDRFEVV